ncbi:MAG: Gfo/Idh/MocA family oxidoreductase [Pyrinomonadaceae bacterium]
MIEKVRWGILGAAKIAVEKVIPSMQSGNYCEITAIASRDSAKAEKAANDLNIPKSYGSYEELLNDAEIEAVYIPLPNHLHLEWSAKAAEAGKHVLCEKPIGLNATEVRRLIGIRNRTGVKIQEAFMVLTHPKWLAVRQLIKTGRIGKLEAVTGFFSYFNDDVSNIRNKAEMGGGALMDIGCYCISISRFMFEAEPQKISALIETDEQTTIDKLTSAMLSFPDGRANFTCSTQLVPFQRMQFLGTKGRIEVPIPFNIPTETPTRILIDDGADLYGKNTETIEFPAVNQYTIQGDLFSKAIRENSAQKISLEDSFANMAAIDAVFRSAETANWETPESL